MNDSHRVRGRRRVSQDVAPRRDLRQHDARLLLSSDSQGDSSSRAGRAGNAANFIGENESVVSIAEEEDDDEDGQYAARRDPLDQRMSINPQHDIKELLRTSITFTSIDTSLATPAASPPSRARAGTEHSLQAEERVRYMMANAANMDGALPEDDGMRSLRQKLQEIKELAVSTEEKARQMHLLMMQDYVKHKALGQLTPPDSPAPRGQHDNDGLDSPLLGAAVMPIDPKNPYNLRPGDLEPVFSPLPKAPRDNDGDDDEAMVDDDEPDLGCMHYKRNVKVQCFDCQRWYPCRHCHDQSRDLPFSHALNRQKTQNMLCML